MREIAVRANDARRATAQRYLSILARRAERLSAFQRLAVGSMLRMASMRQAPPDLVMMNVDHMFRAGAVAVAAIT